MLGAPRAGYANVYVPAAVVTHFGGASTAERYVEHQVMAMRERRGVPPAPRLAVGSSV